MKALKRAFALVLTLAIVMSLGISAFAGGTTYTITITNPENSGVSIKDQTFTAYKILNAEYDTAKPNAAKPKVTYSLTEEFKEFAYTVPGQTNAEGGALVLSGEDLINYVSELKPNSADLYKFAKAALAAAKTKITSDKTVVKADGDPVFTVVNGDEIVKIAVPSAGYYVIDCPASAGTTLNSVVLTTARPDADVIIKVGKPTLDKKILDATETGIDDIYTAEVGKDLTFALDTIVPNMSGYEKFFYEFTDQIGKKLTLKSTPTVKIQVYSRDAQGEAKDLKYTFVKDTDYEENITTYERYTELKLTFNDLQKTLSSAPANTKGIEAGDIMRVTYVATLERPAAGDNHVENTADLTYSNDPSNVSGVVPEEGGSNGREKTVPDTVKVYNVDLDLYKYGYKDNPNYGEPNQPELIKEALTGAKFVLYKVVTQGKPAQDHFYYYSYDATKDEVKWTEYADTAAALAHDLPQYEVENGKLKVPFKGLDMGTYYLEETVAPSGYNKPKTPFQINIAPIVPDGKPTDLTSVTFQYTGEKGTLVGGAAAIDADKQTVLTAQILNTDGKILPETGGIGTTIFYTVGGILMVSALVLLITKKKMSAN